MSSMAHTLDDKIRTKDVLIEEQLNFNALLLSEPVLSGLQLNGFKVPSPIQLKAIPIGKCGFDLIIKSKSGTGKTAVFSIIALENINTNKNSVQALILTPTREIAVQIQDVLRIIGSQFKDLKVQSFIGGLPVEDDVIKLSMCHIAVGAPGRIKHLLRLGSLKVNGIKLFVLDEADKFVNSEMQVDIDFISQKLPVTKQTIASSATFSDDVIAYLNKIMSKPTLVEPHTDTPILLGLKQFVSIVKSNLNVVHQLSIKNDELKRLLSQIAFTQCLIFTNYQTRAESISNTLNRNGWKTMYISAAQNQSERLKVMNLLKGGKCRILLSTDISARGIDVTDIDLVINYDIPLEESTYLHRMGRAGRFGTQGICITIAPNGKDLNDYRKILGAIGGVNVRQLPNEGNLPDNLWNIDSSAFVLIQGIVDNSSKSLKNISASIADLKVQRNRPKEKNSDKSTKSNKLHVENFEDDAANQAGVLINVEANVPGVIEAILNSNKEKEEDLESKAAAIDTISFLKDLASGTDVPALPISRENMIPFDQISLNDNLIDTLQIKKRKVEYKNSSLESRNSEEIKQDEQASASCSNSVLQKNLALFSATRLLCESYETSHISDDLVSTLNVYLDDIKKEKDDKIGEMHSKEDILHKITHEDVENISKKISIETIASQIVPCENSSGNNIEDIFKLSFDYATDTQKKHWLEVVGEALEEKMSHCDIHEDESEFTVESSDFLQAASKRKKHKSNRSKKTFKDFTQKTKKNKSDIVQDQSMEFYADRQLERTTDQVDSNYSNQAGLYSDYSYANVQHFTTCFDNYSDELTAKIQTFEDLQQFETWFAEWQWQVQGVRDYIQQNVYLQEMNKYAYNKQ